MNTIEPTSKGFLFGGEILTPNEMQKSVGEAITSTNNDVVVLSPTGSGKTLFYLLPLVSELDANAPVVQAIVILPGRELALQSSLVLRQLRTSLKSCACYGGRSTMDEHKKLKTINPQIIFSTPGRLNDHLVKGNIKTEAVRFVVIDEFDKCLELGFCDEMKQLMHFMPASVRRILLSATDQEQIPSFVNMQHTVKLNFNGDARTVSDRVSIYEVRSAEKDKLSTLQALLRTLGSESSIVFVNYRESVERVAEYLSQQGFVVSAFHGGLDQKAREAALYRFYNHSSNVLVSTDLASRGLDIPDISDIIHYHLPENEQSFIHRVGRTARWNASGCSYFILGPGEELPPYVVSTGVHALTLKAASSLPPIPHPRMSTIYIGKGKKDKISKGDIVGFLCKQGGLRGSDIGQIDVLERWSYVAVDYSKFNLVLQRVQGEKIKGLKTRCEGLR